MKKRILSFGLVILLVCVVTLAPVKKAHAMGGIESGILGVGATLTGPQALGIGLLVGGVLVSVDYLEEHWTEIEVAISTKANDFGQWLEKAKNRVIDTTSDVWDAIIEWGEAGIDVVREFISGINPNIEGEPLLISGDYTFTNGNNYYKVTGSTMPYVAFLYTGSGKDIYICSFENLKFTYGIKNATESGPYSMNRNTSLGSDYQDYPFYYYLTWTNVPAEIPGTILTTSNRTAGFKACYDYLKTVINPTGDNWAEALGYPKGNLQEGEELGVIGGTGTGVINIPANVDIAELLEKVYAKELELSQALEMIDAQQVVIEKETETTYPIEGGVVSDTPLVPPVSDVDFEVHGLDEIFPFCIPFDLYDLVNVLSAPAEAPKFTWNIPYKGDHIIEVDLSEFDDVATLFRSMMIIVFCIGLALKSRDLIGG